MKRRNVSVIAATSVVFFLLVAMLISCDTGTGALEERDCVVMIGDSIFALSGDEPRELMQLAGQQWRTYYQNGAEAEGGNLLALGDIESQLDRAIREGGIRTIVMDAGGNDLLLSLTPDAIIEVEIRDALTRMLQKARSAGVENIVYQTYYRTVTGTDSMFRVNDNIADWMAQQGSVYGINIHVYNPNKDSWFTSKFPSTYTIYDGIHPTAAASEHMAGMLWNIMVQNNIEQQGDACPVDDESDGGAAGCN